jgi:hypothetical protein
MTMVTGREQTAAARAARLAMPDPDHGTIARYVTRPGKPGCRCEECKGAYRRYQRAGRQRAAQREGRQMRGRRLAVLCWCEETTLQVPEGDVRNGVTGSCGLPGCQP